ncbi:MAG: DNA repair protein RadA [Bacteroidetes bacterium]|nr:DNA repair protein RadA [Bacteroidota bacterium]
MAKTKTVYVCQNCGAQSPKWIGKCPSCQEWNTYSEEIITKKNNTTSLSVSTSAPQLINDIEISNDKRIDTKNTEFNRVLGGGLVPGSLILIGGEPGIGKSTLMLQVSLNISNHKILYVSGEESQSQIRLRADRIGINGSSCFILCETSVENVILNVEKLDPDIIIIDSIQTLQTERIETSPGSISQIRECANIIQRFAKQTSKSFILVGHINKEGSIAGPKILEHTVDTVLQFEGDSNYMYRILRATKNRFGSTSELGIYEMRQSGLRQVSNPSELLMSQNNLNLSGSAVSSTVEGVRPFLIEIQALVSSSVYSSPQRTSTGFDLRRLSMLLAVLEKRAGFRLATKDVFLNIAGGIKVDDPAIDLAVVCAILSSDQDVSINKNICFAGEIGLSGEIRPVNRIEQRIHEAEKLGFSQIFIPKFSKKSVDFSKYDIKIFEMSKVEEVFKILFS